MTTRAEGQGRGRVAAYASLAGFGALSLLTAGLVVGTGGCGRADQGAHDEDHLACEVTDTGGLNDHSSTRLPTPV